jgi:RNA 2',3'-cyclic 3'-phosphodiesterase
MARIRSFLAVDISDDIRSAVESLQQDLAAAGVAAKWVSPADMHITLQFLAEINEREVNSLCRIVSQAGRKEAPFTMRLEGIGAFPNLRRPKIVWVGITTGEESLSRLHESLRRPLEDLGVYRHEDRKYTPHLTLGRLKTDDESIDALALILAKYREWVAGQTIVDQLKVYRSEMQKKGPEYIVLGRGELRGREKKDQEA